MSTPIAMTEAVEETNRPKVDKIDDLENGKFELTKKLDNSTKKDALLPLRPIWLPSPRFVIEDSIKRLVEIVTELGTIGNLPKVELAYAQV